MRRRGCGGWQPGSADSLWFSAEGCSNGKDLRLGEDGRTVRELWPRVADWRTRRASLATCVACMRRRMRRRLRTSTSHVSRHASGHCADWARGAACAEEALVPVGWARSGRRERVPSVFFLPAHTPQALLSPACPHSASLSTAFAAFRAPPPGPHSRPALREGRPPKQLQISSQINPALPPPPLLSLPFAPTVLFSPPLPPRLRPIHQPSPNSHPLTTVPSSPHRPLRTFRSALPPLTRNSGHTLLLHKGNPFSNSDKH